jgi:hypothetical protein
MTHLELKPDSPILGAFSRYYLNVIWIIPSALVEDTTVDIKKAMR